MNFKALAAKIDRFLAVYRDVGLAGIGPRVVRRMRQLVGIDDPGHAAWLKQKSEADMVFDAATGTQTGGVQAIVDMNIVGKNALHGVDHIASDPHKFGESIQRLKIDFRRHAFVDLGSGKGRAIMLAAAYPFHRLIGVEFAAELHHTATENMALLRSSNSIRVGTKIELVHADAAAYDFPTQPLVVYLFNPFSSVIVRRVADNLLISWKAAPRSIQILYAHPLHLAEFIEAGWLLVDNISDTAWLVPPEIQAR